MSKWNDPMDFDFELTIDLEQQTELIDFKFNDVDGYQPYQRKGKFLGTHFFLVGDKIKPKIIIIDESLAGIREINCVNFVCRPTENQQGSFASIFSCTNASCTIEDWTRDQSSTPNRLVFVPANPELRDLRVCPDGISNLSDYSWKMDIFITLQKDGNGDEGRFVYQLDPSATAGSGLRPS